MSNTLVNKLTEQLPDSDGRRGFSFLGRCIEGGSEACTQPTMSIPRPRVFISASLVFSSQARSLVKNEARSHRKRISQLIGFLLVMINPSMRRTLFVLSV